MTEQEIAQLLAQREAVSLYAGHLKAQLATERQRNCELETEIATLRCTPLPEQLNTIESLKLDLIAAKAEKRAVELALGEAVAELAVLKGKCGK